MTALSVEVAEALHEADICATLPPHYNDDAERAAVILAAEIRRLHARVRELEALIRTIDDALSE